MAKTKTIRFLLGNYPVATIAVVKGSADRGDIAKAARAVQQTEDVLRRQVEQVLASPHAAETVDVNLSGAANVFGGRPVTIRGVRSGHDKRKVIMSLLGAVAIFGFASFMVHRAHVHKQQPAPALATDLQKRVQKLKLPTSPARDPASEVE
jgi:hypothetical protein